MTLKRKASKKKVGELFGHPGDPRSIVPDDNVVFDSLVGIEIELEGMSSGIRSLRHNSPLKYWDIKEDGSLRNNGLEFVYRQPLGGKDIIDSFSEIEEFFSKKKVTPSVSDRTSVHVHIDIRDMNKDELNRLILFYTLFEKVLFNYVGKERSESVFCVPFCKTDGGLLPISKAVTGKGSRLLSGVQEAYKYAACNINTISRFGSVEIRIHKGEWRADKLLLWTNILLSLKKAAMDELDPVEIPTYVSEIGPSKFAKDVFKDNYRHLSYPDMDMDIIEGSRVVQDILNNVMVGENDASVPDFKSDDLPRSNLFDEFMKANGIENEKVVMSVEDIAAAYHVSQETIRNALDNGWTPEPEALNTLT